MFISVAQEKLVFSQINTFLVYRNTQVRVQTTFRSHIVYWMLHCWRWFSSSVPKWCTFLLRFCFCFYVVVVFVFFYHYIWAERMLNRRNSCAVYFSPIFFSLLLLWIEDFAFYFLSPLSCDTFWHWFAVTRSEKRSSNSSSYKKHHS